MLEKIYEKHGDIDVKISERIETYDLDEVMDFKDAERPKIKSNNGKPVLVISEEYYPFD